MVASHDAPPSDDERIESWEMARREDATPDREERRDGGRPVTYRWTCPICGVTGAGLTNVREAAAVPVNNLKSHVRTSDEGGHGPWDEVPEAVIDRFHESVEVAAE